MVIALPQAARIQMVLALLKSAQMLNWMQLLILDVNNILTNVSPMAQNVFNSQPVKPPNKQLLVKVIQYAHQAKFVWIGPLVLTIIIKRL